METVNLSSLNKTYLSDGAPAGIVNSNPISSLSEVSAPLSVSENIPVKDGNKKIKLALAGLAAIGTAIAAGVLISKGKALKLSDVSFFGGSVLGKGGTPFSGTIKDKLPNGDSIKLKYKNGILTGSERKGSVNFVKTFENSDGNKIVTIKTQEGTRISNITELASSGKAKYKAKLEAEAAQRALEAQQKAQAEAQKAQEALKAQQERAKILAEAQRRAAAQKAFEQKASAAQEVYNKPFEAGLSYKSAKDSANFFIEKEQKEILAEAQRRTAAEAAFEQKAEASQALYNKPFEDGLSHISARKSAGAMFGGPETKRSVKNAIFDDKGVHIKNVTAMTNGTKTEEFLDEAGNITKRVTKYPDGREYTTTFPDGAKVVTFEDAFSDGYKVYVEENGKLKLVRREIYKDNGGLSDDVYHKSVEYLEDGISKTTVKDGYKETVTFRDKKGNIVDMKEHGAKKGPFDGSDDFDGGFGPDDIGPLDEGAEAIYERWYIHYAKLCKKFGIPMRPCGVEGGAGSHYFELLKMEEGPKEYEKYLELERFRAGYDEKARLMMFLREFGNADAFKELGFTKKDIKTLMQMDTASLGELLGAMKEFNLSAKEVMASLTTMLEEQKAYGYQDFSTAVSGVINQYAKRHAPQWLHVGTSAQAYRPVYEDAYEAAENFLRA